MSAVTRKKYKNYLINLLLLIVLIFALFPIYWMFTMSLKNKVDSLAMPPRWFFNVTFDNYLSVFSGNNFSNYFINSIIISLMSTIVVLAIGVPAAYTLTRMKFEAKKHISFWIISTRMAPPVAVLIPYFIIFKHLGLLDTRTSIILMHIGMNLPLTVWIMQGFFKEIPFALEEAASIDGCSRWKTYYQIILPTVIGGISAAAILAFVFSWNELMYTLTLSGRSSRTITADMYNYISYQEINWGPLCASGMVVLIPIFIFVILVQKRLVQGLTVGIIK